MREETANVVLPAEKALLVRHLEARRQHGVRMNVNFLGEALLGETEARRRLDSYVRALQLPELEVISVKISTLYSQLSSLAFEHTVSVLCDRLELLYRAAARERFRRRDGTEAPKFVYLDMEEYRDLAVTTEVFLRTLARTGLEQVGAGIALQAYLPDSYLAQQRINAWARERLQRGGAPVTIRLVKGANLEMERLEASLRGWKVEERSRILAAVARELRRARGDLMDAALADGGKTLPESYPEVSEVVDFVVFYDLAARYFHGLPGFQARPKGVVVAETGGKNATTVTALGDRELAISHVIHSAFSHRGQKCSATSLLLVEEEVYCFLSCPKSCPPARALVAMLSYNGPLTC